MEHVSAHLRALRAFFGDAIPLRVALTELSADVPGDRWTEQAAEPLRRLVAGVEVEFDQQRASGRGYYRTICFKLHAQVADEWVEVGDGGDVDWTAQLLSDAKERLFVSALGSERIAGLAAERR